MPVVFLALLAVLAGGIGFAVANQFAGNKNSGAVAAKCEVTACFALKADGALPSEASVPVGSYIQFNSADGKSHNISFGQGGHDHEHQGKLSSGEFKSDEAWKVHMTKAGTYEFHDHLNPKINILVVVYKPGGDYRITR